MFAMIILGLVPPLTQNAVYQWVYQATVYPLTMAIFSSLAFYITSAAYRAFRAHNLDATVFLIFGLIIILYNAPIGAWIWPGFTDLGKWTLAIPNMSGRRAIIISAAIGGLVLGLRTLIGHETGWLGGRHKEA
jgi:hypothetical protein